MLTKSGEDTRLDPKLRMILNGDEEVNTKRPEQHSESKL
jgi:hypothetical protein